MLEAFDDVALHIAEERDVLGEHGDVVCGGGPRQECRMFGWQAETQGCRINVDDTCGDHGSEPLAHIALVQPRPDGNFVRSHGRLVTHRIEELSTVADRGHEAERAVVECAQQTAAKGLRLLRIKSRAGSCLRHSCYLLGGDGVRDSSPDQCAEAAVPAPVRRRWSFGDSSSPLTRS